MKKILIFSIILISCQEKHDLTCEKPFPYHHTGFMIHGMIFSSAENHLSIVHVMNPKDWDFNEYFTGSGFSKNENDAYTVVIKDSCELKEKYFRYLDKKISDLIIVGDSRTIP